MSKKVVSLVCMNFMFYMQVEQLAQHVTPQQYRRPAGRRLLQLLLQPYQLLKL